MSLRTKYTVDTEGTTVPYGPIHDSIRKNYGFQDLRGNPRAVEQIPEAARSNALRRLLTDLAQPGSHAFSIGCDLGEHEEGEAPPNYKKVAGGYVQIAAAEYERMVPNRYHDMAKGIERAVKKDSGGQNWAIEFVLKSVAFKFDPNSDFIYPTVWIWFFAASRSRAQAIRSRELLIDAIRGALAREDVAAKLLPDDRPS